MVVIGLTGWTGVARFVRAEFFKLKNLDFVTASRALGASHARIIWVHMLPNAMAPVLVSAVFGIAGAILTESSLSFLGFGVPPPTPSWGEILSQSRDYVEFAWWLTTFPGVAIFLSITAYNLMGEGLRDAMDPKLFRQG
jgi:peptide/nickel transport system permease protein